MVVWVEVVVSTSEEKGVGGPQSNGGDGGCFERGVPPDNKGIGEEVVIDHGCERGREGGRWGLAVQGLRISGY